MSKNKSSSYVDLNEFPSIQFGLEIALKDLENKGTRTLFQNKFTKNEKILRSMDLYGWATMLLCQNKFKRN